MSPGIGAYIHFLISAHLYASLMLRTREFGWLAPNMPWCISPKSNRGWCSRRLRYLRLMCPRPGFLHAKVFKWIWNSTLLYHAQNRLLPRQDRIFMYHENWMEKLKHRSSSIYFMIKKYIFFRTKQQYTLFFFSLFSFTEYSNRKINNPPRVVGLIEESFYHQI